MIAPTLRDGRYAIRLGALTVSQSAFMIAAAVAIGLGGGFGAVGFRALIAGANRLAFGMIGVFSERYLGAAGVVALLALGGAFAAFISSRFAPEAKGHGVPEVMEAVALRGGAIRPRVIAVKSLASAASIGFGGSCGREGPIVQIGSAIGSMLGKICNAPAPIVRTLVACGAAAGISATFNAPIGGVFFAAEVILGDFAPRSFAAIVVASVVSAVIGRAFLGNHPSFSASDFMLVSPLELLLYAALGVIAACWACGFVNLLYYTEDRFEGARLPPWSKGAIGFACVGVIGIWFPQVFGVGYDAIQQVFFEHVPAQHALILSLLKPIATSLTLGGGGSGGVFAPSLFTGAFLGDGFGRVAHDLFPAWTGPAAAYGLVGMAAVFAAAAEAPITSIMIVFEMSSDYTIILPLMVAVVIATVLGRRLLGATIYERKLLRRGIDWQRVRHPRFFSRVTVESVRRVPPVVAQVDDVIATFADTETAEGELAIPVCDGARYVGTVTMADISRAVITGRGHRCIGEITHRGTHLLAPRDTLEHAATLMADVETPLLPVIDGSEQRLAGIVTRRDLLLAYRSLVDA
ncbi:MAG TPA: chloride channel protein [Candidatus Baltobacteraceae bacterium]|nr:chloride channel protein [Candidatus Baltobacteraceae bacterium]